LFLIFTLTVADQLSTGVIIPYLNMKNREKEIISYFFKECSFELRRAVLGIFILCLGHLSFLILHCVTFLIIKIIKNCFICIKDSVTIPALVEAIQNFSSSFGLVTVDVTVILKLFLLINGSIFFN
jgi:hypothetical protein